MSDKTRGALKTILLCLVAEILNFLTADIFYHKLGIPLFFDTIWTVAVVFYLGFFLPSVFHFATTSSTRCFGRGRKDFLIPLY
mgnify:CR=1 FL=1